jgi:hypothetical protein
LVEVVDDVRPLEVAMPGRFEAILLRALTLPEVDFRECGQVG